MTVKTYVELKELLKGALRQVQQFDTKDVSDASQAFADLRTLVLKPARDVLFHSLDEVQGSDLMERVWRCCWYPQVQTLRGMLKQPDADSASEHFSEAVAALKHVCLLGLAWYKTLIVQLHAYFGAVPGVDFSPTDSSVQERALQYVRGLPPAPSGADCSPVVMHVLQKMGDLSRYAADKSLHEDQQSVNDALDQAEAYYACVRGIDPRNGSLHNQLGVVEKERDGSGDGVSAGLCMRFALSSAAAVPAQNGLVNWRRCIGQHRTALQEYTRGHRLHELDTSRMKFTHMIQLASMLAVASFGSGVDGVDLDKGEVYWPPLSSALERILLHASYAKAAAVRTCGRDFGLQVALCACICVWQAHSAMKNCADQVDAIRNHSVYSGVSCLLIQMTSLWLSCVLDRLRAAADVGASAASDRSPSLTAADRILAALRLLTLSVAALCDQGVLVQSHAHLKTCVELLEQLPPLLTASMLAHDGDPDGPSLDAVIEDDSGDDAAVYRHDSLPEAGLVAGCMAFDAGRHGRVAVKDAAQPAGVSARRVAWLARDSRRLARALRTITWHGASLSLADRVAAAADGITSSADPAADASDDRTPAAPEATDTAMPSYNEDEDDIVLEPGQWNQAFAAPPEATSSEHPDHKPDPVAAAAPQAPPWDQYGSLHLPSSLHLDSLIVNPGQANASGEGAARLSMCSTGLSLSTHLEVNAEASAPGASGQQAAASYAARLGLPSSLHLDRPSNSTRARVSAAAANGADARLSPSGLAQLTSVPEQDGQHSGTNASSERPPQSSSIFNGVTSDEPSSAYNERSAYGDAALHTFATSEVTRGVPAERVRDPEGASEPALLDAAVTVALPSESESLVDPDEVMRVSVPGEDAVATSLGDHNRLYQLDPWHEDRPSDAGMRPAQPASHLAASAGPAASSSGTAALIATVVGDAGDPQLQELGSSVFKELEYLGPA